VILTMFVGIRCCIILLDSVLRIPYVAGSEVPSLLFVLKSRVSLLLSAEL
jgi:hypothetical protein